MIPLPSSEPASERYADWVELSTLFGDVLEVSRSFLEDQLHNSGLVPVDATGMSPREGQDSDESYSTPQDITSARCDSIWIVLKRRSAALGMAYPFRVTDSVLQLRNPDWESAVSYSAMLLADYFSVDYIPKWTIADEDFAKLFEVIVECSLKQLLRGQVIRFGPPWDDEWPSGGKDRVAYLGSLFGLRTQAGLESIIAANAQDETVDILGRVRLFDEGSASCYLITQCYVGRDFQSKRGQPLVNMWKTDFLAFDSSAVIGALAVPWTFIAQEDRRRASSEIGGVVLDRMRIAAASPDRLLPSAYRAKLVKWCKGFLGQATAGPIIEMKPRKGRLAVTKGAVDRQKLERSVRAGSGATQISRRKTSKAAKKRSGTRNRRGQQQ